jgi:hypothetical protein
VIVEFALTQSLRTESIETAPDAGLAHVDALQAQLQSSIVGKEHRHLIPEFAIDSVSVGIENIGDLGLIVQPGGTPCELVNTIGKRCE